MRKLFLVFLYLTSLGSFAQQPKIVLPQGHKNNIIKTLFTNDSKFVITASYDGNAKLWDATSGRELLSYSGHSKAIMNIAISPDDMFLATASYDHTIKIWEIHTGRLITTLDKHSKSVEEITFSHNGKFLATSSLDSLTIVWKTSNWKPFRKFKGHSDWVVDIAFSNDDKSLVTASYDKTANVWDLKKGKLITQLIGHDERLSTICFSPDDQLILTGSRDHSVKIWDSKTGKIISDLKGHTGTVKNVKFSPDGNYVASASMDTTVKIWEVKSGLLTTTLRAHKDGVTGLCFSNNGMFLLTYSYDKTAILWNTKDWSFKRQFTGYDGLIFYAEFSNSGKWIVISYGYNSFRIDNIHNDLPIKNLTGYCPPVADCKFLNKSKSAVITYDFYLEKVNLEKAEPELTFKGHRGLIIESFILKEEKILVTISWDRTIKLWNLETGQLRKTLYGHTDIIMNAALSQDESLLITTSMDKTAKIWSIPSGNLVKTIPHSWIVRFGCFSDDGKMIATSSEGIVYIWDIETFQLISSFDNSLEGLSTDIWGLKFSPDSKYILTLCDNKCKVWDPKNGKLIKILSGHTDYTTFMTFSPSGGYLITGSWDGTVRVWNIKNLEEQLVLDLKKGQIQNIYFWDDGKTILVSAGGISREWSFPEGKLLSKNDLEKCSFVGDRFIASNTLQGLKILDIKTFKEIFTYNSFSAGSYFSRTPSGYYKCTPDAAKLLHYVRNDLKVITFEQLDVKYNRPDMVLEAIGNGDTILINSFKMAYFKRLKKLGIDTMIFNEANNIPNCDIKNRDSIEYELKDEELKLEFSGLDHNYTIDRFNVWINEIPLFGKSGISIRNRNTYQFDTSISIQLSQGPNQIETSIMNVNGIESYRIPMYVKYTPIIPAKEKVHFIGIGIETFADSSHNLRFSVKDIRDLAKKMKEIYGENVDIDTLINQQVTVNNVIAIKNKLLKTNVNDKVIISYSGHGILSKDYDYYLSTYAVRFDNPQENGLSYNDLENLLDGIPARKKLLLIDACHSGEVDKDDLLAMNNTSDSLIKGARMYSYKNDEKHLGLKNSFELMQNIFVNVGKSTGATIISAAAGTQFALERNDLRNGVFTYCILDAMKNYKTMKVSQLKQTVGEQVEKITNGLQKPTSRNEAIDTDWNVW